MKIEPFGRPLLLKFEATVNPSEEVSRVAYAIKNVLPGVEVAMSQFNHRILAGATNDEASLYTLYEQFRKRRILGVARRLLLSNSALNTTWLMLNKQAAYAKVVALCESDAESPLGPVRLIVQSPSLSEFIDWIAPG